MAQFSVLLLGGFQVQHHGEVTGRFRIAKVRALFAYLAVEADRPHTRGALAGLFWPEQLEGQALRNLSQALVRLREALDEDDPVLVTRQAVQWRADVAEVDVTTFLELAGSGDPAALERATALYRGEFLAGFGLPDCEAFEDWLLLTRDRLQQQALTVIHQLGEAALAAGRPVDAAAAARRQLALDPWRETAYRLLMRSLVLAGDRAGALAAYDHCRQVLQKDLDITPDEETRLLAEQIEAGELRPGTAPPPASTPAARDHNLPSPLASFVGREDKLAELATWLPAATRLLTVVGAGGSGKSRLALAAAWALRPRFPDGVWWVSLAGVEPGNGPGLQRTTLAGAVAAALEITLAGRGSPLEELASTLDDRVALLVLDNCEHLPEAATVARTLLEAAPRLCVLATSREPLGLLGEQELRLEGLPVPEVGADDPGSYAGVRLFLERVHRHLPGWGQDPAEVVAAGRLCRLLEGLPLGIELAAHWVGHYTPDEIGSVLQTDLDFLTAHTRDVPDRQRSLRAVFDYTWRLLTGPERQALARLSVFRGSFDRAAAQAVAEVAATILAALVDKSLLRRAEVGRYSLHELLRQFAAERLAAEGEVRALRDRHLAHYLALAEQAAPELRGPQQVVWLERLEREIDNLRAALNWARDQGEIEVGLRITSGLWRFYQSRGHLTEGLGWLDGLLQLQDQSGTAGAASVRAGALVQASRLARTQGDTARAATLAEEGLQLSRELGDRRLAAGALITLGHAALVWGDVGRAEDCYQEALVLARETGDTWGIAEALHHLGNQAWVQGEYGRAVERHEESLVLWREWGDGLHLGVTLIRLGDLASYVGGDPNRAARLYEESLAVYRNLADKRGMGHALAALADLAQEQGDFQRAEGLAAESLQLLRGLGERHITAWATQVLADAVLKQGDAVRALALLRQSLVLAQSVGHTDIIASMLGDLGRVAWAQARPARAARLCGAAAALRDALATTILPQQQSVYDRLRADVHQALGEDAFAVAWERGRAMSVEEAIAYALQDAAD